MKHRMGHVEIITGSMFSGKTEELIRRARRATIAKQTVQVFKPEIDTRYTKGHVSSHNGQEFEAIPVPSARDIFDHLRIETTVVAIDEAQFFDHEIPEVVRRLADRGIRVIVAGLNLDFRGEPFGSMPELLARADEITTLHAICMVCGEDASRTQRLINGAPARYDEPIILVGAAEAYEARCREHHAGHP